MTIAYAKSRESDPTLLFLYGIAGYVSILCAATLLQSELLKQTAYAVAISMFVAAIAIAALLQQESRSAARFGFALCLYYSGVGASLILHHANPEIPDLLKFIMAPAFLLVGAAFEANRPGCLWERPQTRILFWSLAVLPVLVWLWQRGIGDSSIEVNAESLSGEGTDFSIFANRNNAALYAVTLLALFNVLSGRAVKSTLLILGICSAFGTLGVLVAGIIALTVSVAGLKAVTAILFACVAGAIAYTFAPELPGLDRINAVISSVVLLWGGSIDLHTVTFGQLVQLLDTTDLSFLFRLKHWLNLIEIYQNGSAYEWLFGLGVGSSVLVSELGFVPHNDYLRFLFECGLLGLLGFASIVGIIIHSCGRQWEAVPFLIIALYFFSENLVNNYLAMTIFYFCAGSLVTRITEERHVRLGA